MDRRNNREAMMRYKLLGRSGLRVSELCLGTMTFGEDWGWGASREESRRIFDAYVEQGGNFVDTANHYTNGTSEKFVGEFIRERRAEMVLATKYTLNPRPKDPNGGGNHRKNLVQSLEASLKRLGTDYIDLYWVHAWDFVTPVEEVMRGLDDIVRAGKVLYVGISDAPAWIVSQANTVAELRGWNRFVGLQIPYSLIERAPERELLPMARALDIAVTTWGPVGGGALTGKYEKGRSYPKGDRLSEGAWGASILTERNLAIGQVVKELSSELETTPSRVAIAWVLAQRDRANIIPVLGARTLSQIQDNLGALSVRLPRNALERLEAASKIELGFPHEFLVQARHLVFGETFPLIDNHRR
jgi:aryl-alcohol dehydrogenase-like predicted oxidoreductase